MKTNVDLALQSENFVSPGCVSAQGHGSQKWYPTVHLTLSEDSEVEIPESGTITFNFSRLRKTEETPRDGAERCEVTLELLQITNVVETKPEPKSKAKEAEEALDTIAAQLAKRAESDEESED